MIKILILTDFSSGYSRDLLKGVVKYSQEVGMWAFYRMPLYYRVVYGDEGVVEWAKKWKADAIIAQLTDFNVSLLHDLNIPIIIQNYKDRTDNVSNLTGDYKGTGTIAADFFIQRSYSKFAYYGMEETVWSRERYIGFKDRVLEFGGELFEYFECAQPQERWTYDLNTLGQWIQSLPKPIALFACDDQFALNVSETCNIFNISVPEEVAILGVDNDELLCNISMPPISSIELDVENGGYVAAQTLHQFINNEIVEAIDIVVKPIQIVKRKSTEMYAVTDKYIMKVIEYIDKNYGQPISVEDILKLIPLSRRLLEKHFRKHVNISIYQFVLQVRIDHFSELLLQTNKPISSIAPLCGFDSNQNVSRIFYKFKRTTPVQFRKMYKKK